MPKLIIVFAMMSMATTGPLSGGFWGLDGWIPGVITWETWFTPAPEHSTGSVVYYAPNVMEATAKYRELSLEEYVDGVSLMSPGDIGKIVWIRRAGHDWEGPFLNVDCAQQNHMYNNIVYRGEVVEVGFRTAEKWGMASRTGYFSWKPILWKLDNIQVYIGEEKPDTLDEPIDYEDWFKDIVEFGGSVWPRPVFYAPSDWRLPDGTFLDSSQ